jgi:hypothetical protein
MSAWSFFALGCCIIQVSVSHSKCYNLARTLVNSIALEGGGKTRSAEIAA